MFWAYGVWGGGKGGPGGLIAKIRGVPNVLYKAGCAVVLQNYIQWRLAFRVKNVQLACDILDMKSDMWLSSPAWQAPAIGWIMVYKVQGGRQSFEGQGCVFLTEPMMLLK